jgi:hypothetical protein
VKHIQRLYSERLHRLRIRAEETRFACRHSLWIASSLRPDMTFGNDRVRFAGLPMQANSFCYNGIRCSPPRLPHVCHRWLAQSLSVIGICVERLSCPVLYPAPDQKPELALAFTVVNLGFMIPFVFGGPLAGVWADRHDHKQIMIVTNTVGWSHRSFGGGAAGTTGGVTNRVISVIDEVLTLPSAICDWMPNWIGFGRSLLILYCSQRT